MIDWLVYPTELGKAPDTIELVDVIEKNDIEFYIYKFSSDVFKDRGDMIGISGGFVKDTFTLKEAGFVFSNFDTIEKDYKKQAQEMIKEIGNYWKERLLTEN